MTSDRNREISFLEAIREVLTQEMRRDETVFLVGEDIGKLGGVFGVTKGLQKEFPSRVLETPISESAFVGCAIGAAIVGMRPVVELMFADFAGVTMDQIVNQAAKLRYISGGQITIPLVIRMPFGAGMRFGAQHSQTLYSIFTHVPGLKIVVPSTPYDAKGLLIEAIRDDNPVMYFEHKMLYGARGNVPEDEYVIPFGKAAIIEEGADVTAVSCALMLHRTIEAVKKLKKEGVSVEIIDLRTLVPMDKATVLESVRKTGRLVIIDEDTPRCSIADYIASFVVDEAFGYLDSPIKRIQPPSTPVSYSPVLEDSYLPTIETISRVVKSFF
jgi:pyruvate dehydrogenase E1 component beta subunit